MESPHNSAIPVDAAVDDDGGFVDWVWLLAGVLAAAVIVVLLVRRFAGELIWLKWRSLIVGSRKFRVVITGGTRGLGFALASAFLSRGDTVFICGRENSSVTDAIRRLKVRHPEGQIFGKSYDVSEPIKVRGLLLQAQRDMEYIDIWINNAGIDGGARGPLISSPQSPSTMSSSAAIELMRSVVSVNLLGTMYCCREVLSYFVERGSGQVFNIDGAGCDGRATPNHTAYGCTKAAIPQLSASLAAELREIGARNVGVHVINPGMVITDLLIRGKSPQAKAIFNVLAELPDVVASSLVDRVRCCNGSGRYLRYLTPERAVFRMLVMKGKYKNRFFDDAGNLREEVATQCNLKHRKYE